MRASSFLSLALLALHPVAAINFGWSAWTKDDTPKIHIPTYNKLTPRDAPSFPSARSYPNRRGRARISHRRRAMSIERMSTNNRCGAYLPAKTRSFTNPEPVYEVQKLVSQFKIPKLSVRPNHTAPGAFDQPKMAVFMAIDGIFCTTTLAAGIVTAMLEDGTQEVLPFRESANGFSITSLNNFTVEAGDDLRVTINRLTANQAEVSWDNLTKNTTQGISGQHPSLECGTEVLWQVQDLPTDNFDIGPGDLMPAFEPVRFSNLQVVDEMEKKLGLDSAVYTFMNVGDSLYCSGTPGNGSELVVTSA